MPTPEKNERTKAKSHGDSKKGAGAPVSNLLDTSSIESLTRTDQLLQRIKDHPLLSLVIATGVVIVAVAAVIEGISRIVSFASTFSRQVTDEHPLQSALEVVVQYTGLESRPLKIEKLQWFDFVGLGQETEFHVAYEEQDGSRSVSVYSTRFDEPQRLFHQENNITSTSLGLANYDGRVLLVAWQKQGSGCFLDFAVYEWDGVGPLHRVFAVEEPFFQGDLWIVDGSIFVEGGNQKHQLVKRNDGLALERYTRRPKYPELGENCHILTIKPKGTQLTMEFDGRALAFDQTAEGKFALQKPLGVRPRDTVLIDDNLEEPRAVRLFANAGDCEWRPGLFPSVLITESDGCRISVSDGYGPSYELQVEAASDIP